MADIGIVIVTYNSGAVIGACLDAALAAPGAELIVVDNASTDNTLAEVASRGVRCIANSTNRGFAAAVNQGIAALDCPYALLLNPDAIIQCGLGELRRACDLPQAAAAGGRLLDAAGRPQIGFMVRRLPTPAALIFEALAINRLWPRNPVNRRYRALDLDYSRLTPVEQPAGAFLMIRRDVWRELGGFDEGFYPLWFEDVDFCRRLADKKYVSYHVPQGVAMHTGGHSIPQLTVEMRHFYWYRSVLRYVAKHYRPLIFRTVCAAVVAGSVLRFLWDASTQRNWKSIADYKMVLRLAGRSLLRGRLAEYRGYSG